MCNFLDNIDEKFETICDFLRDNPHSLSCRKKDINNIESDDNKAYLKNQFLSKRQRYVIIQSSRTVPDPAVDVVIKKSEDCSDTELSQIREAHRISMVAENKIGDLLEMYLAEKLEPLDWVWCSGSFVRAIDFIKKENDGSWTCLQVKNRDNTENSSSSQIRNGTPIQKWFRSFSQKNKTNWENFPDESLRSSLSEEEFLQFIDKHVMKMPDPTH